MPSLDKLYVEVGRALHMAQIVEYNIVSAHILLSKTGVSKDQERQEGYWSRKSLGVLLKPAIDSGLLDEDCMLFLQTVVNARNHLAHSFFLSAADVHTQEGISLLLRETEAMIDVFGRAHVLFEQVLGALSRPHGIDLEEIKKEAQVAVLRELADEKG